jgi:hypothetical protein
MTGETAMRKLFDSPLFNKDHSACDDPAAPAALPGPALDFLLRLAAELGPKNVFEFGSGRSTVALLRQGCSVTSLEDSAYWMEQTVATLSPGEKERHTPLVRPLRRGMLGMFPVMDWEVDAGLSRRLRGSDLILVDSPYYAPFRESTLWSALLHSDHAVVVLDDTRIPTLARFCDRIASLNPGLLHRRVAVGHTFDVFARFPGTPLRLSHTLIEVMKGWRRYLFAPGPPKKHPNESHPDRNRSQSRTRAN